MSILIVMRGSTVTRIPFEGAPVLADVLRRNGVTVDTPCGGKGVCGKCRIQARGSLNAPTAMETEKLSPADIESSVRLACQAVLTGDVAVTLPIASEMTNIQLDGALPEFPRHPMWGRYGLAVDIGTTTLALRLVDLRGGVMLRSGATANPQGAVAVDVIGRIEAALNGEGERLQRLVTAGIEAILSQMCKDGGIEPEEIGPIVVAGNTTMLYLLHNRNPVSLSRAPFEADCLFGVWTVGSSVRLRATDNADVYVPACMSAFVGADITCGVLASGMCSRRNTALLVDLGTNGEIALWHGGTLYCCATAAGPAFEGVNIHRGVGSVLGAIDRVWTENGGLAFTTLGGEAPVGICGSGLIDAVAALLALGIVDETGLMESGEALVGGDVALTQKDIRSVQLAKGAIAAGIRTMCRHVGISAGDIETLYIAGGFGSHVSIANAAAIGLIPSELKGRAVVLGNASLTGAVMMLFNEEFIETSRGIARNAVSVPLGGSAVFAEYYMESMMFE